MWEVLIKCPSEQGGLCLGSHYHIPIGRCSKCTSLCVNLYHVLSVCVLCKIVVFYIFIWALFFQVFFFFKLWTCFWYSMCFTDHCVGWSIMFLRCVVMAPKVTVTLKGVMLTAVSNLVLHQVLIMTSITCNAIFITVNWIFMYCRFQRSN